MDIDRVQHKNIADKLKGAAQSTEPKTKEEEILREKLKESIREKYNHIEEIAALKARVSELEKMLFAKKPRRSPANCCRSGSPWFGLRARSSMSHRLSPLQLSA